jgi:RNA polymerase sigma-70 factor (ECF subfamily)
VHTDAELVEAYRERGEQSAFEELVRRYRQPVFRLVLSILGQAFSGDAEEVAQEVFIRAHRGLASFRGDAQFSSWIYRIAFNQAVNLKERIRYRVPHVSDQTLANTASAAADPHRELEIARRNQAILECIYELPEIYQSAVRLHYWIGASIEEIATFLGVPDNTAKSYLHRSRKLLYTTLKEKGEGYV